MRFSIAGPTWAACEPSRRGAALVCDSLDGRHLRLGDARELVGVAHDEDRHDALAVAYHGLCRLQLSVDIAQEAGLTVDRGELVLQPRAVATVIGPVQVGDA